MLIPGMMTIDKDTKAHLQRTTYCYPPLKYALNRLIRGLKQDGLWDKIVQICVAHTYAADSLLNLKGGTDAVAINAPSFVPLRGFTVTTVDGVNKWVDSQIVPSVHVQPGMTLDDKHMACYTLTAPPAGETRYFMGGDTGASLESEHLFFDGQKTPDQTKYLCDGLTSSSPYVLVDAPVGFIGGSRVGVNAEIRVNGTSVGRVVSGAQTGELRRSIGVGYAPGIFSKYGSGTQFSGWSIGRGLSFVELINLRLRMEAYMKDIKAIS